MIECRFQSKSGGRIELKSNDEEDAGRVLASEKVVGKGL
jgi:hypothetical protein